MNLALDFLLKRKGPLEFFPFLRALKASAELGEDVGSELARIRNEQVNEYGASGTTDLYTPSIQKYESSALGSTRII